MALEGASRARLPPAAVDILSFRFSPFGLNKNWSWEFLAERQLMEGTASSQVITHYLKLGSTKERIEKEILEKQKDLIEAKTQSLQSAKRIEEMYSEAMKAFRSYSGQGDFEPDD